MTLVVGKRPAHPQAFGGEEHTDLSGLVRRSPSSTGSRGGHPGPRSHDSAEEEDADVAGVVWRSTPGSDGLAEEDSGDLGDGSSSARSAWRTIFLASVPIERRIVSGLF